jgi:hypothetical protein
MRKSAVSPKEHAMSQRLAAWKMGCVVLVIFACLDGPLSSQVPVSLFPGAAAAPDPLAAVNDTFRAAYRRAREEALSRTGPVILVEGDDLVLKFGLERSKVTYVPKEYHALKAVAHIPLTIHVLLDSVTGQPLDETRLHDLRVFRDQVLATLPVMESTFPDEKQRQRQKQIVRESRGLLDSVLKNGKISEQALTAFRDRVRPLIDSSVAEAAKVQLDALNAAVKAWKGKLTEDEWKQLTVVVMGSQMPRKDNAAVLYFARLLGEPGEGRRIIYAEALWDEQKALDLLGTHRLDARIGEAFFKDPTRMSRDLLGPAARAYLDELFREKAP